MTFILSNVKYHVEGMDCADCALTLERSVAQVQGVKTVYVNFTTATLEASGDIDPTAIKNRVCALGYQIADDRVARRPHNLAIQDEKPTGELINFIRYLFSDRVTITALIGITLLAVSLLLKLLADTPWIFRVVAAINLTIVLLIGATIVQRGIRALLIAHRITIDLLMSIATLGALVIGETSEAAAVVVLFALGEALEGYTAAHARDAVRSLVSLQPEHATVLRPCLNCPEHLGKAGYTSGPCPICGLHEVTLSVNSVNIGDRVLVRPGERIPVDGRISAGASTINQATVTGESLPVVKSPGDLVFSGTLNGESALEVEVTNLASESTINRIVRLVEQAQAQRAPIERFVDRFAAWYTPAVVVMAVLVASIPPLLFGAPFFDTLGTRGWFYRALALLIIACPCALVISTPVTVVSALIGLARRGVLVKGGAYLDALSRIKIFAFDKTGTLTRGEPVVVQTWTQACPPDQARCPDCDDMLALATSVERRSSHPLASAIVSEAEARQVDHTYPAAEAVQSMVGRGVQGVSGGMGIIVSNHAYFHDLNNECEDLHQHIEAAEAQGQTVMLVGKDDALLGFVGVADRIRPSSRDTLVDLKKIDPNFRTVMLTGDNLVVAREIAGEISSGVNVIDEVRAGLLPEDKVDAINDLQKQYGPVAMIGDGINDAPALAAATVGIAMGGAGSAQAMETADMVLMQDNLARLPEAVYISRQAKTIIKQNVIFSLVVKALFLILALPGLATLWMAVFADMGASILVTVNGMRMLNPSTDRIKD